MDSQFIWNAILSIGMAVISALIALGARYLNQIQASLEKQLTAQDEKIKHIREEHKSDLCAMTVEIDDTRDELSGFKVEVQRDFVNREEYIRTTQSLDAKMDRVLGEISKIQVNVAKLATAQEVKQE